MSDPSQPTRIDTFWPVAGAVLAALTLREHGSPSNLRLASVFALAVRSANAAGASEAVVPLTIRERAWVLAVLREAGVAPVS